MFVLTMKATLGFSPFQIVSRLVELIQSEVYKMSSDHFVCSKSGAFY